jgi:hypothetical protein
MTYLAELVDAVGSKPALYWFESDSRYLGYFIFKLTYKCNEDSRLGMNARNMLNTCEFDKQYQYCLWRTGE